MPAAVAEREEVAAAHETTLRALRQLKGRATVGDVVAQTGVPRDDVETSLRELLGRYRGHLAVGEKGDLVFAFDPRMIERGRESRWSRFKRSLKRFLAGAFKAWIVTMLVVYFVLFVVLLLAAIAAMMSGDRRGGGRRSHTRMRIPTFWIWYLFWTRDWRYGRPYYGHRWESKHGTKVPFYKKVFAFVLGPDEPRPTQEDRDRGTLALIRSRRGVLTAAELIEFTGVDATASAEEMARLVGAYGGDVRVTQDGELVYIFPELMVSAHGGVRERRPEPAWRRLEKPRVVTGNTTGTNSLIAGLNGFNLAASATSPLLIMPQLGYDGALAWVGLFAVPLTFSVLFFAVPFVRRLSVRRQNRERRRANIRKAMLSIVFESSIEQRSVSVAGASTWIRQAIDDKTVTEQEVLAELQTMAVEFDAEIEADDGGALRFRFPSLRSQLSAAEAARSALHLEEQRVGDIVFDTGDSPAEQSQRDLAAFDQKLRRDLPSPDRTAFVDDFEITPQPAPAMLALRRHTPPP